MGYHNPPITWSTLEGLLSDRRPGGPPPGHDGGDGPAFSRKRRPYRAAPQSRHPDEPLVPYAELHAHTAYSFLDGASQPEALVEEAVRLRLHALAVTDHDGFYGIVRMAEAAEAHRGVHRLNTVFGAELSLGLDRPQTGQRTGTADPVGPHLLVLARQEPGYHRLSAAITEAHLRGGEKGRPVYDLAELSERAAGEWMVLTGCRKGHVRRALQVSDRAGEHALRDLMSAFGRDRVLVELTDQGLPGDTVLNDRLAALAERCGCPVVATGNVHHATPRQARLAAVLAAVRARSSMSDLDGWLPAHGGAHLRSGAEMAARFARYPGAVERTVEVADELGFALRSARPRLPKLDVPDGHTPMTWLRELVRQRAPRRYPDLTEAHQERLERELRVIEELDFPGYFLIVSELTDYAREQGILCQGRGSAASSAVCYALGITAVDAIRYDLPFERFLSSLREEPPDIDVDFDSDRREEVIQHVYATYGRRNAAQVANVITYRPRSAIRDVARAFGYSAGQQDAWAKQVEAWGSTAVCADHDIPAEITAYAEQVLGFPRHLGIHSGGMVLTEQPVGEVVPIEHARMENRTVVQWDKDDCAWMGLVKFDLLGLGMLAALQYCFDEVEAATGESWDLATMPKEEAGVYDMLCRADSIGVFQVESRAQIATLPRLRPRRFYDLVIEIALIRPGPIQGGAVHPYLRRKLGQEPVTYLHPLLEPVLERTLGVPLFQEQLMQIATTVGGCNAEEADQLRRAMGSKRGVEKISALRERLLDGMAGHDIDEETAQAIYAKIEAFANFGFAESHSLSFGLLVYASSWVKLHYPAAFLAALLRAQPMGFYSPQSLVADARRHGVEVRRPDINLSQPHATLEPLGERRGPTGLDSCVPLDQPQPSESFDPAWPDHGLEHRRDGHYAVRLGLAEVTGISTTLAEQVVAAREREGRFRALADLSRRTPLLETHLETLASVGAFDSLAMPRRGAVWAAAEAARHESGHLPGLELGEQAPSFAVPDDTEQVVADLWGMAITPQQHPMQLIRARMAEQGVLSVADLPGVDAGRRVRVGGVVTHRQRPATASGITFVNLEDETGQVNVVCSRGLWARYRAVANSCAGFLVRGRLERSEEGVINVVADKLEPLSLAGVHRSRDFR